jgi:hypothetical protein
MVGPRTKVERAVQLRREVTQRIADFHSRGPYEFGRREIESGYDLFPTRIDPVPTDLSAAVGDVIHNLRAALDLLAWQLVEANGARPRIPENAFPIGPRGPLTSNGWRDSVHHRLRGASDDVLDAVIGMAPFADGASQDHDLWVLHQLDIIDKHRLLILSQTSFEGVRPWFTPTNVVAMRDAPAQRGLTPEQIDAEFERLDKSLDFFVRPADRRVAVAKTLVTVRTETDEMPDPPKLTMSISVDEEPVGLIRVEELLDRLQTATQSTLDRLVEYIGSDGLSS